MEDVTKTNTMKALMQRDVHILVLFFQMTLFKVDCDELKEPAGAATSKSLGWTGKLFWGLRVHISLSSETMLGRETIETL